MLVYIGLSILYSWYLDVSDGSKFFPDYLTNLVSKQSKWMLELFGYNTQMLPNGNEPSIKIILNGNYLARLVEGCNSISVIILFISFVIAFSGKLRTTILFVFSGAILIYVVNLLRIALLCVGVYHNPELEQILHAVIFPAIIYGMVFLLWIVWVNKFSKKSKSE